MSKRDFELAYWAGFIDGEGSISIAKTKSGLNPCHFLRLSVYNTNKWLLHQLQTIFRCGSTRRQHKGTQHHKAVWCWNTTTNEATHVLEKLLPYLKLKKPQAQLGIKFNREKKRHEHGWKGLSKEEVAFRENCYQKMIELNNSARRHKKK